MTYRSIRSSIFLKIQPPTGIQKYKGNDHGSTVVRNAVVMATTKSTGNTGF